jgi:hypothetical protein
MRKELCKEIHEKALKIMSTNLFKVSHVSELQYGLPSNVDDNTLREELFNYFNANKNICFEKLKYINFNFIEKLKYKNALENFEKELPISLKPIIIEFFEC